MLLWTVASSDHFQEQTPTRPVLLGPGGVSRVGMATAPNSSGRLTIRSVKFVRSGTESPQGTNMTAPGRERSTNPGLEEEVSSVAPPADHVTRRGSFGSFGRPALCLLTARKEALGARRAALLGASVRGPKAEDVGNHA